MIIRYNTTAVRNKSRTEHLVTNLLGHVNPADAHLSNGIRSYALAWLHTTPKSF
jgi:hypothetical protein